MTASYALQQALYAHLTADMAVMNLITGVHDRMPFKAPHPYLHIEEAQQVSTQLSAMAIETVTLALTAYSRSQSQQEVSDIAAAIHDSIHNHVNLNVAGYHVARLRVIERVLKSGADAKSFNAEMTVEAVLTTI